MKKLFDSITGFVFLILKKIFLIDSTSTSQEQRGSTALQVAKCCAGFKKPKPPTQPNGLVFGDVGKITDHT